MCGVRRPTHSMRRRGSWRCAGSGDHAQRGILADTEIGHYARAKCRNNRDAHPKFDKQTLCW